MEYIKGLKEKKPIIYGGDLNVAHNEIGMVVLLVKQIDKPELVFCSDNLFSINQSTDIFIAPKPKNCSKSVGTKRQIKLLSIGNMEEMTFEKSLEGGDGAGIPDVLW